MGKVEWSDLHEELIDLIADRVPSYIDVLRIGSICKPWRSTVATKQRFPYRFQRNLPTFKKKKSDLSPTAFFRVTLPSSSRPNKGCLIKTRQFSESSKINLVSPFCRELITTSKQTLDLLRFGVSEIRQAYNIQYLTERERIRLGVTHVDYDFFANSARTVLVDNMIFTVDWNKEIWCCKIVDESEEKKEEKRDESSEWRRIESKEAEYFSDITVQRGLVYALDLKGAVWWISLSRLEIFQYRPSTPVIQDYYHIGDYCKDKRLVEDCGDLCVVLRLCKIFQVKGVDVERTVGFKVYKMDRNLVEWVEVSTLGDKAIIMSMESCLMVSASEYYGCLENAIYFTDDEGGNKVKGEDIVKVFKLEDDMIESYSRSFLEMFTPPFLGRLS